MKTPTVKIPATLGACADRLFQLEADRSKAQKAVDKIAAEIGAIEAELIRKLPADDADGVVGKRARATISKTTIAQVSEGRWLDVHAFVVSEALKSFAFAPSERFRTPKAREKLARFIAEHGAFDLLYKKINSKAARGRWDAGVTIPGVARFVRKTVSLRKR